MWILQIWVFQLFSNTDIGEAPSCASSDPAVDVPAAAPSLRSTFPHLEPAALGDPQDSEGDVAE